MFSDYTTMTKQIRMRAAKAVYYGLFIAVVAGIGLTANAFAQGNIGDDQGTSVVLLAVFTAAFSIPLIGYATNSSEPFNVKQYVLAIIVILPVTLGFAMTFLTTANFEDQGARGAAMLFINGPP